MAYRVQVFDDWQLAVVQLFEDIDHEQLVTVANLQSGDPAFRYHFNQLVCVLPDSRFNVTSDEMRHYAAQDPIFSRQTSRAIVVTDNPLAFGFSRMFELTKDDTAGKIKVFSGFADACEFLNRSAAEVIERLPELSVYESRTEP